MEEMETKAIPLRTNTIAFSSDLLLTNGLMIEIAIQNVSCLYLNFAFS